MFGNYLPVSISIFNSYIRCYEGGVQELNVIEGLKIQLHGSIESTASFEMVGIQDTHAHTYTIHSFLKVILNVHLCLYLQLVVNVRGKQYSHV